MWVPYSNCFHSLQVLILFLSSPLSTKPLIPLAGRFPFVITSRLCLFAAVCKSPTLDIFISLKFFFTILPRVSMKPYVVCLSCASSPQVCKWIKPRLLFTLLGSNSLPISWITLSCVLILLFVQTLHVLFFLLSFIISGRRTLDRDLDSDDDIMHSVRKYCGKSLL